MAGAGILNRGGGRSHTTTRGQPSGASAPPTRAASI